MHEMKVLFYSSEFVRMHEALLGAMRGHDVDTADEGSVASKIVSAEVLVSRPGAPLDSRFLRDAPNLKLQQQWGAGLEGIDFAACQDA